MKLEDVVKAFLASMLDNGHTPEEIRAAFKACGFVTDPKWKSKTPKEKR